MRALTLIQPWAGLVAAGVKCIENRPRSMIRPSDFGKPFGVHAGGKLYARVYHRIAEIAPDVIQRVGDPELPWQALSRIRGAVIAVAVVERVVVKGDESGSIVVDLHTKERVDLGDQHRWFFGPYGYVIRGGVVLPTPVICGGAQPFWHMPPEIERKVMAQI